eukprot:gene12590-6410_t
MTNRKRNSKLGSLFDSNFDSEVVSGLNYDNNETMIFDLRKDSLFVENNQTVVANLSNTIKPLTLKHVTETKVQPGNYIVEVTNKNEKAGNINFSISISEDIFSKKYYSVSSMQAFQKFFNFDEDKTIHISIHPDLNVVVDYSLYIYKIEVESELDILK